MDKAVDKAPDAFRTISEVADDLDLPQHVLRFWETRFIQIRPMKRGGGRRFYRREDVELLRGIRHLLYGEGYTIRGVQRILKDNGVKFVQSVWQAGAPQPAKLPIDGDEHAAPAREPARGRRLFGILPARDGGDAVADEAPASAPPREEPRVAPATPARDREALRPRAPTPESLPRAPIAPPSVARSDASAPPMPGASGRASALPAEQLRKLQATLHELGECRRLIDAALDEKP